MGNAKSHEIQNTLSSKRLGNLPHGVVRLTPEDEDEVVELCAEHYAALSREQDSALWNWVMGPNCDKEDPLRVELLQWVYRFMFREMTIKEKGFALGIRAKDTGKLVATCVACPNAAGYGWCSQAIEKVDSIIGPTRAKLEMGAPPCSREPVRASIGEGIEKRLYNLWKLRELPSKANAGQHLYIGSLACAKTPTTQMEKAKLLHAVTRIADKLDLACYMVSPIKDQIAYFREFCFSELGPFEVGPSSDVDGVEPFKEVFALVRPTTRL